jgi:rhodanese-related sulfurtransferase
MKNVMIFSRTFCFLLLPALLWHPLAAESVSVETLADQLSEGEAPVLIDLRSSSAYQAGHIPNAINLPFPVMERRALPPLGEVVIYGDGLGRVDMDAARKLMEAKPDITCRVLAGGYAAWETRSGVTTSTKGLRRDRPAVITYEDLMKQGGEGLVIYDLRKPEPSSAGASLAGASGDDDSLRDKLPKAQMASGSPLALLKKEAVAERGAGLASGSRDGTGRGGNNPLLRENALAADELIVLIDDDNKTATDLARQLRAGGFRRVVVLAGGDLILEFEGRPGLSRQSSPVPFENSATSPEEGEEDAE